jgi:hypothetical protein
VTSLIASPPTVTFFHPKLPTTVSADASSFGLGGVLQLHDDVLKPVAFCSRTLTEAETKYSQLEKELLAVVWTSEKFSNYLTGLPEYSMLTDHQPIEAIVRKNLCDTPIRCQRLLLRLMRYNPVVTYVPGKEQVISDALSRNPLPYRPEDIDLSEEVEHYVASIQAMWPASPSRLQEIKNATIQDHTLALVSRFITTGWPESSSIVPPATKPFFNVRNQLSVVDGLIAYNDRIVIPEAMQKDILTRRHETHQGLSKLRERAALSVWWPGIGSQMKAIVDSCLQCHRDRPSQRELPLRPVPLPGRPWEKLAADLCMVNKKNYLVVVDYYSRWLHIDEMKITNSASLIRSFKRLFSNHGIPDILVSDNGPQFASAEFANFATLYGFAQHFTNPYKPQENGMAERHVQEAKKILTQSDPALALLNHRATPHSATGISPALALMGRELCTRLPVLNKVLLPKGHGHEDIRIRDEAAKTKYKLYFDRHHGAKELPPLPSEAPVTTKLDSEDEWHGPFQVLGQEGRSVHLQLSSGTSRRCRKHVQPIPSPPSPPLNSTQSDSPPPSPPLNSNQSDAPDITQGTTATRSGRIVKPVQRLDL